MKIRDRFNTYSNNLVNTVKRYPISIVSIFVDALLFAVAINYEGDDDLLVHIIAFLSIFALQGLFCEEWFHDLIPIKYIGIAISCLTSAFFSYAALADEITLFRLSDYQVHDYMLKLYGTYLFMLFLLIVYHMAKRSELPFERYLLDTTFAVIKTMIVYGLFAIGILGILAIFNTLIYDFDEMIIAQVEIFLAGGILNPALILAISNRQEKVGKFAKGLLLYVLLPILTVAFAIIYLYIFKMIIKWELPSNEVFSILAFLFIAGFPVWTLAVPAAAADKGISVTNTVAAADKTISIIPAPKAKAEAFFARIAKILPLTYIPFIVLQVICVSLRINEYGITSSRYFGIVLIIIEIIYFALYILQNMRKKEFVKYLTIVFCVLAPIVMLVPGINVFDMEFNSQLTRLHSLYDTYLSEGPSNDLMASIDSTYDRVRFSSYFSDEILEQEFSDDDLSTIRRAHEFSELEGSCYIRLSKEIVDVNISGFEKISEVRCDINEDAENNLHLMPFFYRYQPGRASPSSDGDEPLIYADGTQFVYEAFNNKVKNAGQENNYDEDYDPYLVIDDDHVIFVTSLSATCMIDNDHVTSFEDLYIIGLLMER